MSLMKLIALVSVFISKLMRKEMIEMSQVDSLMDNIVGSSENLEFIPLSDSVLSPDDISELKIRVRPLGSDYRMRNTDFKILDVIQHMPGIDKKNIAIVHDVAAHKPQVTKRFRDSLRTFDSLRHYGEKSTPDGSYLRSFRIALSFVEDEFKRAKLNPIKISHNLDIDDVFTHKSASAGAIGKNGKLLNWEKIKDYAFLMLNEINSDVPFQKIWIPAMPFHRSQLHDLSLDGQFNPNYKEKDRLIWGLDAASVLIEALYARPLIDFIKDQWYGYAGGKTPVVLRSNISESYASQDYWYSTDYSKFDQTIPDWLIHNCFNIIRNCYPKSQNKILNWVEYNFINTKLVLPDGRVVVVHKGIPSGSYFTQLVGSMANAIMMLTYLVHRELNESSSDNYVKRLVKSKIQVRTGSSHLRMFVMGDDNLFFYKDNLDIADIANYVHHVFGVVINADKTVTGHYQFPKFLSRVWKNGGEDRDQLDMLLQVVLPERQRTYANYTPEDIMFSLWYTFEFAFHCDRVTLSKWFNNYFNSSGHNPVELASLPNDELPGSAKVFTKDALRNYVDAARIIAAA